MTHQPRLPLTIADKLDAFLAQTTLRGLRIKALRISPEEFRELHRDPDAMGYDHTSCRYRNLHLRIATHKGPSPWDSRSYYDGTERRFCTRMPITSQEQLRMQRRAGDVPFRTRQIIRVFGPHVLPR